ncbi:PIB2 [Candida pseudojiufengensis]|uniref:PIB2 n=1 Tax=Candida pseudojiufengensis TaxID=497109 RepID=UPI0022242FA5|nr:PIB2 [Candida pseudojiufengensis]KAI5963305.1 PIB2 [Candida pseudojiufengensis]
MIQTSTSVQHQHHNPLNNTNQDEEYTKLNNDDTIKNNNNQIKMKPQEHPHNKQSMEITKPSNDESNTKNNTKFTLNPSPEVQKIQPSISQPSNQIKQDQDTNGSNNNDNNNIPDNENQNGSQQQEQQQEQPQQQQQQLPSPTSSHHSHDSKNSNNPKDEDQQTGSFNNKTSDISFTKKDLSKSRTQSFQSVLSIASLKSFKQQHMLTTTNQAANPNLNRNNSSNNNPQLLRTNSAMNNLKNFQSFIQAPVLSSINNQKSFEDLQIGEQLPFNDKPETKKKRRNTNKTSSTTTSTEDDNETSDNEETLQQQKNLTLNALKKLSLSPRPITNPDDLIISQVEESNAARRKSKTQEPYQPAEVDLSSFASLTRQPKVTPKIQSSPIHSNSNPTTNLIDSSSSSHINKKHSLPRLPEGELVESTTTTNTTNPTSSSQNINQYHQDLKQSQLESFNRQQEIKPQRDHFKQPFQSMNMNNLSYTSQARHPVVPPQDINTKRKPSNPGLQNQGIMNNQLQQQQLQHPSASANQQQQQPIQQQHPSHQQHSNEKQRTNKQLQQIKGLRNPMYVPAVLRMTQSGGYYLSNRSGSNSPDILSSSPNHQHNHRNQSQSPDNYETHLQAFGQGKRDSSTASIKSTDSTLSLDSNNSPKYTSSLNKLIYSKNHDISKAPPTRKHWIKDDTVFKCSIPTCTKIFNFFERRHHCRKCGGIFCKEHTSHLLYINHMAQFTTGGRGTLSKVCDNCISEYNEFIQREFGVSINPKSPSSSLDLKNHIINPTIPSNLQPQQSKQNQIRQSFKDLDKSNQQKLNNMKSNNINQNGNNNRNGNSNRSEQLVGSVPANWSWSSF